jgi:hypothetical protein
MKKQFLFLQGTVSKMALLFYMLLPFHSFSQHDSCIAVENFSRKNFVQPYVCIFSRFIRFISTEKDDRRYQLRFSPNSSAFAGAGVSNKKLFLYFEKSIPGTFKLNRKTSEKSFALLHITLKINGA